MLKPSLIPAALLGLLLLAGTTPARAHHSFGMFDMQKQITIAGVVKDYQWTNPHVWLDIITTDVSKNPVAWSVECDSISIEALRGWTRISFKPGDAVTLVVHPLRDGSIGGSLVSASINGIPVGHDIDFNAR